MCMSCRRTLLCEVPPCTTRHAGMQATASQPLADGAVPSGDSLVQPDAALNCRSSSVNIRRPRGPGLLDRPRHRTQRYPAPCSQRLRSGQAPCKRRLCSGRVPRCPKTLRGGICCAGSGFSQLLVVMSSTWTSPSSAPLKPPTTYNLLSKQTRPAPQRACTRHDTRSLSCCNSA